MQRQAGAASLLAVLRRLTPAGNPAFRYGESAGSYGNRTNCSSYDGFPRRCTSRGGLRRPLGDGERLGVPPLTARSAWAATSGGDPAAVALVRSRDEADAFTAVFDAHFDAIYGYLRRRLGPTLAEDVAAEAFARAFDCRHRYDPARASVRAWLHGIAANLIRGHLRDERRRLNAYARAGSAPGIIAGAEDSDARADAESAAPRMAVAIAALRRQERDVLLLYAWAELSYEEIAQALGTPIGTVRSRLARARARLRDHLDPEGTFE